MVDVFGKDIIGAYTGGAPVRRIFSHREQVWPEREIPPEYERYDYIHSYIQSDTHPAAFKIDGIPWGPDTSIEAKVKLQTGQSGMGNWILAYSGGVADREQGYADVAKDIACVYGTSGWNWTGVRVERTENYTPTEGYTDGETHNPETRDVVIKLTPTAFYVNDVLVQEWSRVTGFNSIILSIFGYWNWQQSSWDFRSGTGSNEHLYWLKVKVGDTLLYKFVPAVRVSDGVKGLWDETNKVFHIKEETTYYPLYVGNDN